MGREMNGKLLAQYLEAKLQLLAKKEQAEHKSSRGGGVEGRVRSTDFSDSKKKTHHPPEKREQPQQQLDFTKLMHRFPMALWEKAVSFYTHAAPPS